MLTVLIIGAGGAIGAIARYLIGLIPINIKFPIKTLLINIIGALVIGIIVGVSNKSGNLSKNWENFLKIGICGGFTTFSTFSLETLKLIQNGQIWLAVLYAAVSVALCVLGVYAGESIINAM